MNLLGWKGNVWTETFQNVMSLSVSLYTYVSLFRYWFEGETDIGTLRPLAWVILAHCVLDLPLAQNELVLHHLLVMGLIGMQLYNYGWQPLPPHMETSSLVLFSTELSTLFYVIRVVYDKWSATVVPTTTTATTATTATTTTIMKINDVCFLVTFYVTRGYLLFTQVVAHPEYYRVLYHYAWIAPCAETRSMWINLGLTVASHGITWVFFALNLYWCTILGKKMAKQWGARGSTDEVRKRQVVWTESVVKWGGVAQLGTALYCYRDILWTDVACWVDLGGTALLAATTWWYHGSLERLVKSGSTWNVDVLDDAVLDSYIADVVVIHLRVPLYLVSLTMRVAPHNPFATVVCCILHAKSVMEYVAFVVSLWKGGDTFLLEEPEEGRFKTELISLWMGWPIFWSTLLLMVLSGSIEWAAAKATVYVLLCLAMWFRPLYDMNHAYVHALLLVQTWIMCSVNK